MEGNRTTTKSFRLTRELAATLSRTSLRLNLTETQYVSNCLRKLLTMEPLFQNIGVVTMSQTLFQRIIGQIDHEGIEILGSEVAEEEIPTVFESLGMNNSLSSFEDFMKVVLEPWGWFKMETARIDLYQHELKLFHNGGLKWSEFLKYYLVSAFEGITKRHPEISISSRVVVVKFQNEIASPSTIGNQQIESKLC